MGPGVAGGLLPGLPQPLHCCTVTEVCAKRPSTWHLWWQVSYHPDCPSSFLGPGTCDASCGRCTPCPVHVLPECQANIEVRRPAISVVRVVFKRKIRVFHRW